MKNRQKDLQAQKKLRRELEILKAQVKSLGAKQEPELPLSQKQASVVNHDLPIKTIKRDLTKTAFFTLLAAFVLVGLQYFKVDYTSYAWLQNQVTSLFRQQ
ncbi:MAG: hypothetical protein UX44_C0009G0009 [candidate division WWE3 bacterium GW2011_GWA1_46_21]|uniref:Uncharacterized protein n=3 Tax=Katanobacteria TaxID=422282 RepID=A0A0G1PDT0_UNCKA|nr:MAG: hypothetical protein UX44_C0009G0009 [candidate division WWE3 bacterium GW2011_GWA1_46_21]KKU50879.1 MAG: hypothetical protein UX73_C0012G0024 [candidate division WWE3 bacterium GW2011_GWC1_47_10]KKU58153.1 MAG: hypothetical protein UX79_C0001G0049 [candidate division WWE3 bacterium GW2011_GWB1_47_11]